MRIAIVTETFLPKMDGIVRMLTELLTYLAGAGHDAVVFAPGDGPTDFAGFPVVRFRGRRWRRYPGLTLAGPAPRLPRMLRDWRPDLVHLAGPAVLGAQAALAGRLLGVPLAAHFQTDLAAYARHYRLPVPEAVAWRYLRAIHALADRTYCPTPAVRQQLQVRGFRALALCARGVDTVQFAPHRRDPALRARLLGPGADPATPLLLYVGRLALEKNLAALVTLAQERPALPLLIVGDGPARGALAAALHGARVHFTGELRGDALAAAYASADLCLCPSQTETYCQVAQEALASGLPVAGFRAGGVPDVVAHGETGLLCAPGDNVGWLTVIDRLVQDAALRGRLAARARTVATGRTWAAVFDRLLAEYHDLARAAVAARPPAGWLRRKEA